MKEAQENGVDNLTLHYMLKRDQIERAAHGLYVSTDIILDPYFIVQYRCPKAIFSHETALFFHDLSDREPFQLMMTIPTGWNSQLLTNPDMLFFYCKPSVAELGICKKQTPFDHTVNVYDAERTICDCLIAINKLDKDLVLTALKQYMKNPEGDKAKLLEYAEIFKIRDMIRQYMEVLS